MKKCAQCGSDYPQSNTSCPKCGYGSSVETTGYSFNKTGKPIDEKTKKLGTIIVIVVLAIVVGSMIFVSTIFNKMMDFGSNQPIGNSMTVEECKNSCDDGYIYMNGVCTCSNLNTEF